jgi:probable phosphoglycerate mutase
VTVLLLIRHGHTDVAGKVLTGITRGIDLNDRGREEAAALVGRLEAVPVEAIYTSPLERCRQTLAPLARDRGLSVVARRGLLETDYGRWTGRSIASLRRTALWRTVQRSPSAARFPEGESLLEVQARVVTELQRIAAAHASGTVVVGSHADPIRLALAHFAGAHPDHVQRWSVEPASISVVALRDGAVQVVKVNDTGGLDALRRRSRGRARRPRGELRG